MDDVLVVGEALIDIVQRPSGASAKFPGGSPAKVALALARLGRGITLPTKLGDDPGTSGPVGCPGCGTIATARTAAQCVCGTCRSAVARWWSAG
jgi:hypothetical protein